MYTPKVPPYMRRDAREAKLKNAKVESVSDIIGLPPRVLVMGLLLGISRCRREPASKQKNVTYVFHFTDFTTPPNDLTDYFEYRNFGRNGLRNLTYDVQVFPAQFRHICAIVGKNLDPYVRYYKYYVGEVSYYDANGNPWDYERDDLNFYYLDRMNIWLQMWVKAKVFHNIREYTVQNWVVQYPENQLQEILKKVGKPEVWNKFMDIYEDVGLFHNVFKGRSRNRIDNYERKNLIKDAEFDDFDDDDHDGYYSNVSMDEHDNDHDNDHNVSMDDYDNDHDNDHNVSTDDNDTADMFQSQGGYGLESLLHRGDHHHSDEHLDKKPRIEAPQTTTIETQQIEYNGGATTPDANVDDSIHTQKVTVDDEIEPDIEEEESQEESSCAAEEASSSDEEENVPSEVEENSKNEEHEARKATPDVDENDNAENEMSEVIESVEPVQEDGNIGNTGEVIPEKNPEPSPQTTTISYSHGYNMGHTLICDIDCEYTGYQPVFLILRHARVIEPRSTYGYLVNGSAALKRAKLLLEDVNGDQILVYVDGSQLLKYLKLETLHYEFFEHLDSAILSAFENLIREGDHYGFVLSQRQVCEGVRRWHCEHITDKIGHL
jgi:hypothetical protein